MSDRIQPQLPINFNGLTICGESAGRQELIQNCPFVGASGKLLNTVLVEIGIERARCHVTNVFMERPQDDKIDQFFRPVIEDDTEFIARYGLYRNRVVKNDNRIDMDRLDAELVVQQPKVIVLLGATALWRMTKTNGITEARGNWVLTQRPGIPHLIGVIASWHPSAVLRDRSNKLSQFVADFKQVHDVLEGLQTRDV